jgi:hydroxymethylpyrimidine pyrophosphatase-like HAD family hydrolase
LRYHALACDYDGTLATDGVVDQATLDALDRLQGSGRKLILVTGRELGDLLRVFPHIGRFERVVAENGALLYRPATGEEVVLAEPPPAEFIAVLREKKVRPLSLGRVIVATWEPFQTTVREAIRNLDLELQVVFNKGAVMVLPLGVDKAVGLKAALAEMELSLHQTVGVGDAENDEAMLSACHCSAAVANALQRTKDVADIVTAGSRGAGVAELIDRIIATDLQELG